MKNKLCDRVIKFGKCGLTYSAPCRRYHRHSGVCSPDLTGLIFGDLKVLGMSIKNSKLYWQVTDSFGRKRDVYRSNLINRCQSKLVALKGDGLTDEKGRIRPEYTTICNHASCILDTKNPSYKSYKGMPFYGQWNPKKGGSFAAGMRWIIENLPPRKRNDHLHIINRKIGFVPGNLMWLPRSKHKQEELLNKVLLENAQLRKKLSKCA